MSDSHPGPPPRPKPGSLRDRIAAFERPAQAAQTPGPPPPRPKPAGVQWRPRQQQQQQGQAEDGDGHDPNTGSGAEGVSLASGSARAAGTTNSNSNNNSMSASDARESIRQGGSLKDRMAALQGRGAFGGGAPSPSAPPPPSVQKPKWKPVAVVPAEGEERVSTRDVLGVEEDKDKDRPGQVDVEGGEEHENRTQEQEQEQGQEKEKAQGEGEQPDLDPEEDERQRRAAIAARMAKLGGARVGMAPMFGGPRAPPPRVAKKPEVLRSPTTSEAEAVTLPPSSPPAAPVPAPVAVEDASAETEHGAGSDGSTPLGTPSHSRSPPPSMPAPAVPRRTAPPRRKPPKSPAQAGTAELETQATAEHLDVLGDAEPLTKEERREVEVQPVEEMETVQSLVAEKEEVGEEEGAHEAAPVHEEAVVEEPQELLVQEPEQEQPEKEEEEEAETRRKRIAERIAKMGAINPLAPPPISRGSVSDEAEATSPPASIKSAPVRRSSVDSVGSVKSGGLAKRASIGSVASPPPVRRSSVDSVSSSVGPAAPARRTSVDSVKEVESGSAKGAVVGGIPEQDEREEAAVDENVPEEEQVQEEGSNDALAASMIPERPPPIDIEREAHETIPVLAPPVDRSTRPPVPISDVPSQTQTQIGTFTSVHQRRSSGYVTRPTQSDEEGDRRSIEQTIDLGHDEPSRASPPPLPISPRTATFVPGSLGRRFSVHEEDEDDDEEEEEEPRPLPVPHRSSSMLSPRPALKREPNVDEEDRKDDDQEEQVKHVPPPPKRQVPLPPPSVSPVQAEPPAGPPPPTSVDSTPAPHAAVVEEEHEGEKEREQKQEQAPEPSSAHSDAPLVIPPPADRRLSKSSHATRDRPLPHPMSLRPSQAQVEAPRQEIMDDEEGDPIDPSIYVPKRSPGHISQVTIPEPPPPPPPASKDNLQDQDEGGKTQEAVDPNATDMEAARRRTIAERMAKLGGIKFGAAPPVPVARLPSVAAEEPCEAEGGEERKEDVVEAESGGGEEEEKKEVDEEEEERARKERIAAKLAGMGGMRIGMMPSTMGFPPRPPQRPLPPTQVKEEAKGPPTRPPPPPHSQEAEWERDSASNSEDGVKVEMEESDIEEVNHEDARTEEDHEDAEVVAPPPPPRVHPPSSPTLRTRPPVPSTATIRRGNTLGRRDSSGSATTTQTVSTSPQRARGSSDFVMVEEPLSIGEDEAQDDVPPPPPARPPQRRLTHEAPPQHSMSDSISSQWELPSIPSGGLGLGAPGLTSDLSMSWTETDDLAATMVLPAPPPPPADFTSPAQQQQQHLSPEELTAIWKRVGVQICEAATLLYEKSKKSVVGDGTYAGFVNAALSEVPNAARRSGWGCLVYAQTGSAVQKRLSEIMTGDVVELVDARFKGHKGLQTYSQHVGGAGGALVGVVSEVEQKKSKVKVLQANQHVGQQTVESVSYRLEDLKSGTVKVYRILEA